jgi:hypothetical protein
MEIILTTYSSKMLHKIHQTSCRLNMNLHDADIVNKAIEMGLIQFCSNLEKMINEENVTTEYLS